MCVIVYCVRHYGFCIVSILNCFISDTSVSVFLCLADTCQLLGLPSPWLSFRWSAREIKGFDLEIKGFDFGSL